MRIYNTTIKYVLLLNCWEALGDAYHVIQICSYWVGGS